MSNYPAVFEGYERRRPELVEFVKREYIREFDLKPGRMLDAACGEGFWGDIFAEQGFDVTGFDLSAQYVTDGRFKYPRLELLIGTIDEPLNTLGTYDLVFCRQLSHFYNAPDLKQATSAVRNLRRHVNRDGRLLLAIYTEGDGSTTTGLSGGKIHYHSVAQFRAMVWDAGGEILKQTHRGRNLHILCR